MTGGKILGTTTVSSRWRISLIKNVRDEFADDGFEFEEGDSLVYRKHGDRIVIEPSGPAEPE